MTGIGSDWIGFGLFYLVGLVMTINVVNLPRLAKSIPWQFRMLIVVFCMAIVCGGTVPKVDGYVQGKIAATIPVAEMRVPPPVFSVLNWCSQSANFATPGKPDIVPFIYFSPEKKALMLRVMDPAKAVAMNPSFSPYLWDLDADDFKNPLQVPAESDAGGFIRNDVSLGPFGLTSGKYEQRVKSGDHIFGFLVLSCPSCLQTRVYWIYAVMGSHGWYAEAKKKEQPSVDLIAKSLEQIKASPEAVWNSIHPHVAGQISISGPF